MADQLFYWTGVLAWYGLVVLGAAILWFQALRLVYKNTKETYYMAEVLSIWLRSRRRKALARRRKESP